MFKSLLGKVMSKIADISPVRNLIKYILDRTLNQFLSDQIQIDDFKDVGDGKVLTLTNIALNQDKINRESLLSSPYILHAGTMGKLNIKLPNLSQLASKSIEISADRLVLDLKPNKKFAQNFKEAMKEQQQNVIIEQMEEPGQISESSPLDFFRQLVKQMLLNMVIKFQNVVVRLFINQPSEIKNPNKPQYYLMFRVPLLTLGKSEDVIAPQQNVEKVRFDAVLPQFSIHLLREGVKYPEFANEKAKQADFPFTYPSLKHPGTLLVMGRSDLSKDTAVKLRLTLTTNYSTEKKELNIEGGIGSIEATVDPIQIKILSRFIVQLQQFQKVFKSVMVELNLITNDNYGVSGQSIDFTMSRTSSAEKGHKSPTLDFFSSMVMSISEHNRPLSSKHTDFYSSIVAKPELRHSAQDFNEIAVKELAKSGETLPEGYKNISFKQDLLLNFNMERLKLNFLKYVPQIMYARGWSIDGDMEQVNISLSCSHFRGEMRNLQYSFSTTDNKHKVSMKFVTLHDVKLPKPKQTHVQPSQEFFQIDSSTYYNEDVNQDYFTSQPELLEFQLNQQQHFCMEQLLRVSDGASPNINTSTIKRYSFMPEHPSGEGEGLSLIFNSHKKILKIEVKEVAVMANFQIWKDALNIVFPIFLYKQLVEKTTISGEYIRGEGESESKSEQMKVNPFESQYIFTGDLVQQTQVKEQSMGLVVEVGLIYCMYRETSAVAPHQNLITQIQTKVHDYDNFSHGCFCDLTERALYAQVFGFSLQKERENMNIDIKEVKTGFLSLKNSYTSHHGIEAFLVVEGSRIQEINYPPTLLKTRVSVPRAKFNLQLSELVTFVDMMKKVAGTIESLLNFKKNLSSKIVYIDLENDILQKEPKEKIKKDKILEVFCDQISLKMILITTNVRSLYLKKEGKNLDVRLNSLAVGLLNKITTSLGQFRNQLMLTTYPDIQTFEGIYDTSLILELGRLSDPIVKKNYNSEIKSKLTRKLNFFQKLSEQKYSLTLLLNQKTEANIQKYSQKQFKFNKNPKRDPSVIDEEKHSQCIDILLISPLHIYLGNAAFLARQKESLENIVKRVTEVLEDIKNDSKEMMKPDRKDSVESNQSEPTEILVKIKGGDIMLDLRPEFSYDPKKSQRVLSNTRLIVKVCLNKFELTLCPQIKLTKIDTSANLQLFFLHHMDKDVQVNPTFVDQSSIKSLGFRNIATLGELVVTGEHSGLRESGAFEVQIDDIKLNLCISSIPYLELFWEHFFKHSISGDFGIEQNYFEVLEGQAEDVQILTSEEIEELEKKIEQKKITQKRFQASEFMVRVESIFKGIFLKKVLVNRISMNFCGGNEFKFIDCNSLYESKPTIRKCSAEPDATNFVSLMIQKFAVQALISQQTKTLVEFQHLAIDYTFNRMEGLMWKNEKSYTLPLLKIQKPLRALMHIGGDYFQVKISHLDLAIGVTDQLLTLASQFSSEKQKIVKSGWKLGYLQEKKEVSKKTILVIAPAGMSEGRRCKISLSAEFKSNKILTDQSLYLQQLFIHEPMSNSARINIIIEKWVKDILFSNLGSLVTGAFSEVIYSCVQLLIGAITHILGFFFLPARD